LCMKRLYRELHHHSKKRFFWWILMPSLVLVTALCGLFFLPNPQENPSNPRAPKTAMIIVPENATMAQIADTLKRQGFLRSEITFRAAAKLIRAGHKVHGGTFQIHPGLSN